MFNRVIDKEQNVNDEEQNANRILILGGCGYIGSALFPFLRKKFEVDTVDLEWFGNLINAQNVKEDFKNLKEEVLDDFDTIILLAGHSSVQMCDKNMMSAFKNNVITS